MVSLPIDFVSHPKIPFSLQSKTSETGGSVLLFREKKFLYVLLQFCFEAKFGDTLMTTLMFATYRCGTRPAKAILSKLFLKVFF